MAHVWIPKNIHEVCKRAAGRRRYLALRRRKRDARQLIVMDVLLALNWKCYGFGRILAHNLNVDAATISRDIKYLRNWRTSFMKRHKDNEQFVDAIIFRLLTAGIHPRQGYSWTYTFENGVSNLSVKRIRSPARGLIRIRKPVK